MLFFFGAILICTLKCVDVLVLSARTLSRVRKIQLSFFSALSVLLCLIVLLFRDSTSLAPANDISSDLVTSVIFDLLGQTFTDVDIRTALALGTCVL